MTEGKQFTLSGDPAEEEGNQVNERLTTTTTAGRTRSTTSQPTNISEYTCDEEVQEWINSLPDDAAYGYAQLKITIKQELDGSRCGIRYSQDSSEHYTRFPRRVTSRETPASALRSGFQTLFDSYATPVADGSQYPVGRAIPHKNLRLFIPAKLFEIADVEQAVVEDLLAAFHSLEEYNATQAEQRLYERRYRLRKLTEKHKSGWLYPALRLVKITIQHKLKFPSRYGDSVHILPHEIVNRVPEADPQYEDWSLNELGAELDHIRKNIGQAQVELEQVRDDIAEQTLSPDSVKQQVLARTSFDTPAFLRE